MTLLLNELKGSSNRVEFNGREEKLEQVYVCMRLCERDRERERERKKRMNNKKKKKKKKGGKEENERICGSVCASCGSSETELK